MAEWLYTRALLTFRQEGASRKANKALKEALAQNEFVPNYLLGKKRLPRRLPEYMGFGDEKEAIAYASEALGIWRRNPDALDWLEENLV